MTESHRPYTPDTWPDPRSGIVFLDELSVAQLKRRKFTVEEFYRMVPACILGEDTLEELIDGDVMVRAWQTRRHSSVISKLMRLFMLDPKVSLYANAHCPIHFDDYNEPVADIALLPTDPETEHPRPLDVKLLIEVASTVDEAEYNRGTKLPLYARHGIPELWLFALETDEIEVSRQPTPEGYADVQLYGRGETLTIQALPEVRLAVDELLQ